MFMRSLLATAFSLLLVSAPASSTTFTVLAEATDEHPALILVEGKLDIDNRSNEAGYFSAISANIAFSKKTAIVFFNSPGGSHWTGNSDRTNH
jgi:hypothetical protein